MSGRRYVQVRGALVDRESEAAARFLVSLLVQRFRHGLPARRRAGLALAAAARVGAPGGLTASMLRKLPARSRPDVDRILDDLVDAGFAEAPVTAAALPTRAGLTLFVFGRERTPMLVAKLAADPARLEREAAALDEAAPADVAPRFLGRVGDAWVQEAVAGFPLPVTESLRWMVGHIDAADALVRLAATTRKRAVPVQLRDGFATDDLAGPTQRAVEAAERDLRRLEIAVLQHADTSPQNCLVRDGRFSRFVDWEQARPEGAPGFDVWNLGVACLEHRLGVSRWSDDGVVKAFADAWSTSAFFRDARLAARRAAVAAGVPEDLLDQLEIAFFARRVVVRKREPARFPTGARVATRMLEIACAP